MADRAQNERPAPTTMAEAMGGPLGMAETALPTVAYVITYTATKDTKTAAIVAVGLALVLSVARLARRESPRHALSGLVGVALAAFIAAKTGNAADFFVPGFIQNVVYGTAMLVSIAVRWPLVGVIVTKLDGEDNSWRADPVRLRAFRRATWLWVALFFARLVVQVPMYLADALVPLGVARTVMGIPLFALCLWLTWLIVRGVRQPAAPQPEPEPEPG